MVSRRSLDHGVRRPRLATPRAVRHDRLRPRHPRPIGVAALARTLVHDRARAAGLRPPRHVRVLPAGAVLLARRRTSVPRPLAGHRPRPRRGPDLPLGRAIVSPARGPRSYRRSCGCCCRPCSGSHGRPSTPRSSPIVPVLCAVPRRGTATDRLVLDLARTRDRVEGGPRPPLHRARAPLLVPKADPTRRGDDRGRCGVVRGLCDGDGAAARGRANGVRPVVRRPWRHADRGRGHGRRGSRRDRRAAARQRGAVVRGAADGADGIHTARGTGAVVARRAPGRRQPALDRELHVGRADITTPRCLSWHSRSEWWRGSRRSTDGRIAARRRERWWCVAACSDSRSPPRSTRRGRGARRRCRCGTRTATGQGAERRAPMPRTPPSPRSPMAQR